MHEIPLAKNTSALMSRKSRLMEASKILKKEFVGLDEVIDQVLHSMAAWYCLPDIQLRPNIINIWGLTGTGKTSVIHRLLEILDLLNNSFQCLGNEISEKESLFREMLENASALSGEVPKIFIIDEWQRGKTIDRTGAEKEFETTQFWAFLDTGIFNDHTNQHYVDEMARSVKRLRLCQELGVEVVNGIVSAKFNTYKEVMQEDEMLNFLQEDENTFVSYGLQLRMVETNKIPIISVKEMDDIIRRLDIDGIIRQLEEWLGMILRPAAYNFHDALIIFIGNLDDAYEMSSSVSPDAGADEFHRRSKEIGIQEIKTSLLELFMPEQVARLGNNHILFPTFDESGYRELIRRICMERIARYSEKLVIKIDIDESMYDVIYLEGVVPAQGVRPLYATIDELLTNRIPDIFLRARECNAEFDRLLIEGSLNGEMMTRVFLGRKQITRFKQHVSLKLQKTRNQKSQSLRASVAVHEAGHILLQVILQGILPDLVTADTASRLDHGFTTGKEDGMSARILDDYIRIIAVGYGGFKAESIVFGPEKTSIGSQQDISNITRLAGTLVKEAGLGSIKYTSDVGASNTEWTIKYAEADLDKEVEALLKKGELLAEETLLANEIKLIGLARELYDRKRMKGSELKAFLIEEHGLPDSLFHPWEEDFDIQLLKKYTALYEHSNCLQAVGEGG